MQAYLLRVEVDSSVRHHAQVGEHAFVVYLLAVESNHRLFHMIGDEVYEGVALLARLHCHGYVDHAWYVGTVVAHLEVGGLGNGHRVGAVGEYLAVDVLERQVYVKLETAHDYEVVPELAAVLGGVAACWRKECEHGGHDGVSAAVALVAVGDGDTVVHHVLYVAPVLGQYKLLELVGICEHFCAFYPVRRLKDTPKIPNRQNSPYHGCK